MQTRPWSIRRLHDAENLQAVESLQGVESKRTEVNRSHDQWKRVMSILGSD